MNNNETSVSAEIVNWKALFASAYEKIERAMPNLQKAMTIGVDPDFKKYLLAGTNAELWHFTHVQMALERIFVTHFLKESPGKHDRIPIDELRKELHAEFKSLQKL